MARKFTSGDGRKLIQRRWYYNDKNPRLRLDGHIRRLKKRIQELDASDLEPSQKQGLIVKLETELSRYERQKIRLQAAEQAAARSSVYVGDDVAPEEAARRFKDGREGRGGSPVYEGRPGGEVGAQWRAPAGAGALPPPTAPAPEWQPADSVPSEWQRWPEDGVPEQIKQEREIALAMRARADAQNGAPWPADRWEQERERMKGCPGAGIVINAGYWRI